MVVKVVNEMISIMKLKIVFLPMRRLDIFFLYLQTLSTAHGCERILVIMMISIMKIVFLLMRRIDIFFPVITNIVNGPWHGCERIFSPEFTNIINGPWHVHVKEDELILQS